MKRSNVERVTVLLILLIFLFISSCKQVSDNNLTEEEIINKAWKAMFGELKKDEIKSIFMESYFHGRTVPRFLTIKRPNLFRNEGQDDILVFDGKRAAWAKRGPDEKGNPRGPELIDSLYWRHFDVDIAIAFPAFFDYPSELKGIKKYDCVDESSYEIYVDLPLGSNVTYFVDTKSFLVTRRLVSWEGNPDDKLWENIITNNLDYNGILFPDGYTFEGREGEEKGYFKNVKFNTNPGDDLFKIPAELN